MSQLPENKLFGIQEQILKVVNDSPGIELKTLVDVIGEDIAMVAHHAGNLEGRYLLNVKIWGISPIGNSGYKATEFRYYPVKEASQQ